MAGISSWSRSDRIAFYSLIVTIVGVIVAIAAFPGIRVFLGLEHPTADVIVCLRYTGYQADSHAPGDDLVFGYQLLNRGPAEATVTSIHIGVFGPNVNSHIIMPTNFDTLPGMNLSVPGNTLTAQYTYPIYVRAVKESSFQYAMSWVVWTNGRSQQFTHANNGTVWTNDSAC